MAVPEVHNNKEEGTEFLKGSVCIFQPLEDEVLRLFRVQGIIASGLVERAHKAIDGSIVFAHSDNWANPCLETAFYSARAAFI